MKPNCDNKVDLYTFTTLDRIRYSKEVEILNCICTLVHFVTPGCAVWFREFSFNYSLLS